jgi:hypothetical protein
MMQCVHHLETGLIGWQPGRTIKQLHGQPAQQTRAWPGMTGSKRVWLLSRDVEQEV